MCEAVRERLHQRQVRLDQSFAGCQVALRAVGTMQSCCLSAREMSSMRFTELHFRDDDSKDFSVDLQIDGWSREVWGTSSCGRPFSSRHGGEICARDASREKEEKGPGRAAQGRPAFDDHRCGARI